MMPRQQNRRKYPDTPSEFEEKVIEIKRVSKKTKGGNKIGFTALVIVGDRKGKIGVGLGKASDVTNAIQKAISVAKKKLVYVKTDEETVAHEIKEKFGSAEILIKPASAGTGIVAGGSVRQVFEVAGIHNVSAKILGSNNKTSNVKCVINALSKLKKSYDAKQSK